MKKTAKILSFILLFVLTLAFVTLTASAEEITAVGEPPEMTVTASSAWGNPGDVVDITISLEDNPGIASMKLDITYDSYLILEYVEFNTAFGAYVSAPAPYYNTQTLNFINPMSETTANGIFATITFKISEAAPDKYSAPVTVSCSEADTVDKDLNRVDVNTVNGKVDVYHGLAGDVDGNRSVNNKDAILLFQYVSGWGRDAAWCEENSIDLEALNVNGDDAINNIDAITLFRYVAGWDVEIYRGGICVHSLTHYAESAPTCTDDGNSEYWHCNKCDKYYSDAGARSEISIADTVTEALGHDYEIVGSTDGDCETESINFLRCKGCGKETQENLGYEDHDYSVDVPMRAPTCNTLGYAAHKQCYVCGEHEEGYEVYEKIDHVFNVFVSSVPSVCGTQGYEIRKCATCDETEKQMDENWIGEHTYDITPLEPTCNSYGHNFYFCTRCGHSETRDIVIPYAHHLPTCADYEACLAERGGIPCNMSDTGRGNPPTCKDAGSKIYACNFCGEEITVNNAYEKTEHSFLEVVYEAANCQNGDGEKRWQCTFCNEYELNADGTVKSEVIELPAVDSEDYLNADYHTVVTEIATPATCEGKIGLKITFCKHCDVYPKTEFTYTQAHEPAKNDAGEYIYIEVVNATCTVDGYRTYNCVHCGQLQNETLTATGHTPAAEWTTIDEPDCTTDGLKVKYCTVCTDANGVYNVIATHEVIPKNGHDYVDDVCTNCGALRASEGLVYALKADGTYEVSGIGTCMDTEIIIPATYNGKAVTSIGNEAFGGCSSLTRVTIPESVTSIGFGAFASCTMLTSMTIPNSVTIICEGAFSGCERLVEVINLSGLNITVGSSDYGYIGYYAKTIHTGESKIVNKNDYLFITGDDGVNYLFNYIGNDTVLTLPESYNGESYIINNYAFFNKAITKVTIPDSVTSIGYSAFSDCASLASVTIPGSVTEIGWGAFSYCSALTSVTIDNGVAYIGGSAFYYCTSLTSVTIPGSVTSIGSSAFRDCSSLTSVTIPDSVTEIGSHTFSGCYSLTSVVIGSGVTTIGESAFYRCTSLTGITIPSSVTKIGSYAFYICTRLTSVVFEDTSTWYRRDPRSFDTTGTQANVTSDSQNARDFKNTYYTYYWYKI